MRDEWSCRQLPSEPHQRAPRSRCCLCSKLINGPNYSHHQPTSNPSCDSIARARYIAIAHSYPLCMGSFVLDWWLGERTNNLEEAPFFLPVDEIGFPCILTSNGTSGCSWFHTVCGHQVTNWRWDIIGGRQQPTEDHIFVMYRRSLLDNTVMSSIVLGQQRRRLRASFPSLEVLLCCLGSRGPSASPTR